MTDKHTDTNEHALWCISLLDEPWCDCGAYVATKRAEAEQATVERIAAWLERGDGASPVRLAHVAKWIRRGDWKQHE